MIPKNIADLWCSDRSLQNDAFHHIMKITGKPVAWAYDIWDDALANLKHKDNHNRAIAAQLLCNLAKSDPQNRLLADFNALFAVTKDERFVTARHCLQSLWKAGAAGGKQRALLVAALELWFNECVSHKNCTLIRYDIVESLRNLFDAVKDENIRTLALRLIESETDLKYRKKYSTLWRPGLKK
jgi:hypothetical protein